MADYDAFVTGEYNEVSEQDPGENDSSSTSFAFVVIDSEERLSSYRNAKYWWWDGIFTCRYLTHVIYQLNYLVCNWMNHPHISQTTMSKTNPFPSQELPQWPFSCTRNPFSLSRAAARKREQGKVKHGKTRPSSHVASLKWEKRMFVGGGYHYRLYDIPHLTIWNFR